MANRALRPPGVEPLRTTSWWQHAVTIARFTLLECARMRLLGTVALTVAALVLASLLVEQVAIAESTRVRTVLFASSCRFATVALLCQYIIASVVRELNDAGIQFVLTLPTPRSALYIGKLAAFCTMALLIALVTGIAAMGAADAQRAAVWGALLCAELSLMAGVALFCALGTRQSLSAMLLCGSFYLVGRGIAGFERLMATHLESDLDAFTRLGSIAIQILAAVLPDLSRFARAEWLADASPGLADLTAAAAQTAIYLALTASAGIHDLKRRIF